MTKEQFCREYGLTEDQFYGRVNIEGSLDLESVKELPQGFNPTVGGSLDLESVKELPKGFNPTVGGNLYLGSVTKLPQGFNPIVGGFLDLESVKELPQGFNPTVGWSLYLNSVEELPKGFNPTVGGSLYLNSVEELPKGFNPTVGGFLDLESVKELPEDFNPTVGGNLYWKNSRKQINNAPTLLSWGKYIKVDEIFTEVISKKGNVWKVREICGEPFFLVTDGSKYAHGKSIKEARESLLYKISDRDTSRYKNLNLDSVLTLEEMIECYRVITGACEFGTKQFVESVETKKEYTVREVVEATKGQYGNEVFNKFFKEVQ